MNGKSTKFKLFPYCPDCGYIMLPRPQREQDGCLIRPLYCAFCDEEKDILTVEIIERRPEDRFAMAVRR
jgi:hypothetical protein